MSILNIFEENIKENSLKDMLKDFMFLKTWIAGVTGLVGVQHRLVDTERPVQVTPAPRVTLITCSETAALCGADTDHLISGLQR